MDQPSSLLEAVEVFLTAHRLAPVTFGRLALRDPHFVRDLREGRRCWPETEARVRIFMAEYQPDKAAA